MKRIDLSQVEEFEWDEGNRDKNKKKHKVEANEAEEVILNNPVFIDDKNHSQLEERYIALGITNNNRFLFVVITIREEKIRVISARDQDKKEKAYYLKNKKGGQ